MSKNIFWEDLFLETRANWPVVCLNILLTPFKDQWDTAVSYRILPNSFLSTSKPVPSSSRAYAAAFWEGILIATISQMSQSRLPLITSSTRSCLPAAEPEEPQDLASFRILCNTLQTLPAWLISQCAALPVGEVKISHKDQSLWFADFFWLLKKDFILPCMVAIPICCFVWLQAVIVVPKTEFCHLVCKKKSQIVAHRNEILSITELHKLNAEIKPSQQKEK